LLIDFDYITFYVILHLLLILRLNLFVDHEFCCWVFTGVTAKYEKNDGILLFGIIDVMTTDIITVLY